MTLNPKAIAQLKGQMNDALAQLKACTELLARCKEALADVVAVMDDAGREAMLKELTDAEVGRLWLATVDKSRTILAELEALP